MSREAFRWALFFERQWLHALALIVLVAGFAGAARTPRFRLGELWGMGAVEWAWLAVALAIAHQGLVWLCWRAELHGGWVSGLLGPAGFEIYAVLFSIIGIARVVAVWCLAVANESTLPVPAALTRPLAVLLLAPALWTFYSVRRYFGFRRAFGADHFDAAYRGGQLERRGTFRFVPNSMYVFGFLVLWVPALWWGSVAALWTALFNHLYIWVHYYATEKPDMRRIYGV